MSDFQKKASQTVDDLKKAADNFGDKAKAKFNETKGRVEQAADDARRDANHNK